MGKNKNKQVLEIMRQEYYQKDTRISTPHLDWMGYEIDNENSPSYHHITKASTLNSKQLDSSATIENGAYLGTLSHTALHEIEKNNKELYDNWNKLFEYINKVYFGKNIFPDEDILEKIKALQEESMKIFDSEETQYEK